ncbi:MAG: undecaprenyldiphospho-muramoylpentapeptide beta-N-acetylglucosaminyltransferase [Aerococcus sp.]|nr:undecaprenyldiphospho-muramoylpentapeptide beta-N-acetylglucosaminyltransferase [Aerococcus sp.]
MRLIFSGGGTGGHIYPSLALINRIKRQDPKAEILYVGTEKGLEATLVPKAGIPFQTIRIQGIKRSLSLDNVRTVWYMLSSVQKAKQMIADFKPDAVIGTGGYVCAPVLYAASRMGIPTIIHEQNSIAGLTNKFLARYVDRIAISFESVANDFKNYENKVVYTGNPRAQEVVSIEKKADLAVYGLSNDLPTLLVFGGSRGAQRINEVIMSLLAQLEQAPFQTLIATGDIYYKEFTEQYPQIAMYNHVKLTPYIDNMPEVLNAVDCVIARSGATTLTELTALGKPSILIPSPNVTHNHQQRNAESLVVKRAAEMIVESDLNEEQLMAKITKLMTDDAYREAMGQSAAQMGVPDAADRLLHVVSDVMTSK